jgi:hypothetical protein
MFLFRIPKNVGVPVTSTREILLGWQLPPGAQAEIAMRTSNFIELARPVSDALLSRFVQVVREEQQQAVEQGAKSDTDPLWAAPSISEAWCSARLGLDTGNLDRHNAIQIITAIETFATQQASRRQSRA